MPRLRTAVENPVPEHRAAAILAVPLPLRPMQTGFTSGRFNGWRTPHPNRRTRTRHQAPLQTKLARCARSKVSSRSTRPSRPTSFRAHNHELKRATGAGATSSNAGRRARVLSLVPAGSAPLRAPGRLLWLSDATPGGPLAALARDGGPTSSEAGSAAGPPGLSDVLRARGQ